MSAEPVHTLNLDGPLRADDLPVLTWPKLELVDGSLIATPWPGNRHQLAVMDVATALQQDLRGYVVLPGGNLYDKDGDDSETLLIPDVLVFTDAAFNIEAARNPFSSVTLVVEVLSKSTAKRDRILKPAEYHDRGVGAYWTLEPRSGLITVVYDTVELPELEQVRRRWTNEH